VATGLRSEIPIKDLGQTDAGAQQLLLHGAWPLQVLISRPSSPFWPLQDCRTITIRRVSWITQVNALSEMFPSFISDQHPDYSHISEDRQAIDFRVRSENHCLMQTAPKE
jgi:hypothetical protein